MVHVLRLPLVAALLLFFSTSWAAKTAQPPSHELRAEGHYLMAVAKLAALNGSVASFRIQRPVFGEELPKGVELALDLQTAQRLSAGSDYLIAFTRHEKNKFPPYDELVEIKPKLLRSLFAGEGITAASPAAIAMLSGQWEQTYAASPKDHLVALLDTVSADDPLLARMAAAEILGRPDYESHWGRKLRKRLSNLIVEPTLEPVTKDLLMQVARSGVMGDRQLRSTSKKLLERTSPNVIANDIYWPTAIRGALIALGSVGKPGDASVAEKWLLANHRAIVESALVTAASLRGTPRAEIAQQILQQSSVPDQARQVLEQRARLVSKD